MNRLSSLTGLECFANNYPALKCWAIFVEKNMVAIRAKNVFENSPAIYGWVHGSETSSVPSATAEYVVAVRKDLSSLAGL